jgi:hypothetical protein
MAKIAIVQCADTGPLESIVHMLNSVGYTCKVPGDALCRMLKTLGCDTIIDPKFLYENYGYSEAFRLDKATVHEMNKCDLYVDIKAQRNGKLVAKEWPNLANRIVWYRINGGEPEHIIRSDGFDCGDERNPGCPIITPNLNYAKPGPWSDTTYTCWPPFYRFRDYAEPRKPGKQSVCLIHNLRGWGYEMLGAVIGRLGVKCYGLGSPDGLIKHAQVAKTLRTALSMVHLKSSDAPGYALYEALSAACPLILSRRLIWRNAMQDMYIPNETCLVFDRETHDELTDYDVKWCMAEIGECIERLSDPVYNAKIGEAGRAKLVELMWNVERDSESFANFLHNVLPK